MFKKKIMKKKVKKKKNPALAALPVIKLLEMYHLPETSSFLGAGPAAWAGEGLHRDPGGRFTAGSRGGEHTHTPAHLPWGW